MFYFNNGKVYSGNWKHGKPEGEGIVKSEKSERKSMWKHGKPEENI